MKRQLRTESWGSQYLRGHFSQVIGKEWNRNRERRHHGARDAKRISSRAKVFCIKSSKKVKWGKNWSDRWVWKLRGCWLSLRVVSAEHCRKKAAGGRVRSERDVRKWQERAAREGERYLWSLNPVSAYHPLPLPRLERNLYPLQPDLLSTFLLLKVWREQLLNYTWHTILKKQVKLFPQEPLKVASRMWSWLWNEMQTEHPNGWST